MQTTNLLQHNKYVFIEFDTSSHRSISILTFGSFLTFSNFALKSPHVEKSWKEFHIPIHGGNLYEISR